MNVDNYQLLSYKSVAEQLNDLTYTDFYYRLMLLAKARFEWTGLPEEINKKQIEKILYSEGRCIFFFDKNLGYMVTSCSDDGTFNYDDEPTKLQPKATNYTGDSKENNKECVVIKNNDESIPTWPTIRLYAMRLTDIQRTQDININAQKTPVLIVGSEKQKNTLKQVYVKWNGNEPVIMGDKTLDTNLMKTLNTQAPIVFDKLQIQKHALWNECMTFLGVNNANMDKRERLVDDEVQANNEQIELSANVMLKSRQEACELINKMFPNLKEKVCVKLRDLTPEEIKQLKEEFENEFPDDDTPSEKEGEK